MVAILDLQSARFKLFFIYKSPQCFLPSFETTGFLVQEKKRKIDFQDGSHGGHLRFPIGTILAIFDLQVTPMLPIEFRVNWLLGLREEAKKRFSRCPWWPCWTYNRYDFSYFLIYRSPQCFPPRVKSTGLSVQEKKRKIYFRDGGHDGHLGDLIGTILAIFDL